MNINKRTTKELQKNYERTTKQWIVLFAATLTKLNQRLSRALTRIVGSRHADLVIKPIWNRKMPWTHIA